MWLRKEIWHHRKMHRLTVIATAMAVFLLMSVNILSDGLLKMIKTKTGDMGLDVSLLQVRDEEMMNEYLLNDLVRKTEIEKLCRVEEYEYGDLKIVCCDKDIYDVFSFSFLQGAFPEKRDYRNNTAVAVLGYEFYEEYGCPETGNTISINGVEFTVCGILNQYSENLFMDMDNSVFIPSGYFLSEEGRVAYYFTGGNVFLEDHLSELLGKDGYVLLQQQALSQGLDDIMKNVKNIMMVIAYVSLAVALLGQVNISLSSIEKRSYEIGIKKSLGCSDRDIYGEMIRESVTVLSVAALFGCILAGILMFFMHKGGLPVSFSSCTGIIGRVLLSGLACSLYPAYKASKTSVIGSIRKAQ